MTRRRIAIVAAVGALIVAVAIASLRDGGDPGTLQGYVEGEFLLVGAEDAGRITAVAVEAGDRVAAGDMLFALDASTAEAQRAEAAARLKEARAKLENLQTAQQRPEQIAVLQAAVEQAKAAVGLSKAELERQRKLFQRGISAKAALDQAQAAYDSDAASLEAARRQVDAAELKGRSGEIAAAAASVEAAGAALTLAARMVTRRSVAAPEAAQVEDVLFRAGEVVAAGQAVVSLLPDANRKARFYVPEPMLPAAATGTPVTVTCDGCAEEIRGRVSFVSREAEYTPPVIFSEQERAKLVFRVEASLDGATNLPVGLPVTVRLAGAGTP